MRQLILSALMMTGLALPAAADCATAGLRTRCIYVGPSDNGQIRMQSGARFVTVAPSGNEATVSRQVGTRRVAPARVAPEPALRRGDILPDNVLILMNPPRYGLPRPRDGWTYFTVGDNIYRADIITRRVLNHINPHITRY